MKCSLFTTSPAGRLLRAAHHARRKVPGLNAENLYISKRISLGEACLLLARPILPPPTRLRRWQIALKELRRGCLTTAESTYLMISPFFFALSIHSKSPEDFSSGLK